MRVTIDGTHTLGTYRVDCECGTHWTGEGARIDEFYWSPALPISEAVVHQQMAHRDQLIELRFSQRFARWLGQYWSRMSSFMVTTAEHRP